MSEVKHIPGPYKYDPDNDRDDLQIRDARASLIASVEDNRIYTLKQCQATAKLFAAAPDLLQALIDVKKHLSTYNNDKSSAGNHIDRLDIDVRQAVLKTIENAIDKATQ